MLSASVVLCDRRGVASFVMKKSQAGETARNRQSLPAGDGGVKALCRFLMLWAWVMNRVNDSGYFELLNRTD